MVTFQEACAGLIATVMAALAVKIIWQGLKKDTPCVLAGEKALRYKEAQDELKQAVERIKGVVYDNKDLLENLAKIHDQKDQINLYRDVKDVKEVLKEIHEKVKINN